MINVDDAIRRAKKRLVESNGQASGPLLGMEETEIGKRKVYIFDFAWPGEATYREACDPPSQEVVVDKTTGETSPWPWADWK